MHKMCSVKREPEPSAGQWLREQRERRGMSVRDLATALYVATPAVYDWQNGKSAISDERAEQIAAVLDMPEIEVRRNVGLWVPTEEDETLVRDLAAASDEEVYQALRGRPPAVQDWVMARLLNERTGAAPDVSKSG